MKKKTRQLLRVLQFSYIWQAEFSFVDIFKIVQTFPIVRGNLV